MHIYIYIYIYIYIFMLQFFVAKEEEVVSEIEKRMNQGKQEVLTGR